MLPKLSLLDELKKGGFEASLMTTYNAYLPFYEEVVLRRLVNAGVRHNVLMMDAQQYAVSLASHPPRLAGRHYTLVPLKVPGAFHPKLIFLAGKHKGLVLVGSHNMTLAGFGFNRELTNVVRIEGGQDSAGIALAQDVWEEVDHWLARFTQGVPGHAREMVLKVRELAPWLQGMAASSSEVGLLAGRPGAPPLWDQFLSSVEGPVSQVAIAGAFFDRQLRFVDQVNEDLAPQTFAVAVDPRTVEIPPAARSLTNVALVNANQLGADEKEEPSARYLHAKGIMVRTEGGEVVFASGSANPSAPAWLASEKVGNVELMIVRRGTDAEAAAQALGLTEIPALPLLSEDDWADIAANVRSENESPPHHRVGLAVVEDDQVSFDAGLLEGHLQPTFSLCNADGVFIDVSGNLVRGDHFAVISFPPSALAQAAVLEVRNRGELVLRLLLHHARVIEEQARTGTQRRFREALASLASDSPNIEAVLDYVHKIVTAKDGSKMPGALRHGEKTAGADDNTAIPETLAIDVSQIKRHKSRSRLLHSGDLTYLLDALIFGLRLPEEKVAEGADHLGRSEEEQIGAEDDEESVTLRTRAQQQDELLRVCHEKVRTIVSRMIAQLDAFSSGTESLASVTMRLLAVLAVLRELRRCDGRVQWVEKGKTTVLLEQRLRLLEGIMLTLFERSRHEADASLLNLYPLGEEFEDSHDVARLKGLILWLAWDCGLTLDLQKPFNEDREALQRRLKRNAMVLALAQMVRTDELVIDEARESIGSLTVSELDWLLDIQKLAEQCATLRADTMKLQPGDGAEPGDIAFHRKRENWDLRVVASNDGHWVYLIRLGKDVQPRVFKSDLLAVARLNEQSVG